MRSAHFDDTRSGASGSEAAVRLRARSLRRPGPLQDTRGRCHPLADAALQPLQAGRGCEALARWRERRHAVVLTDCNMPQMDGYELARGE